MNSSGTITKIAQALVKAQKNMGNATKDAKNPFFKSTYADLNAVREVALPALNAEGIAVLQPNVSFDGRNYVETLLLHESGEWISGFTEVKNTKGDAQGEGSGISYSRRYGLQSLLNIGAVDDDAEATMGRKETTKSETPKRASFRKPTVVATTVTQKLSNEDVTPAHQAQAAAQVSPNDGWE